MMIKDIIKKAFLQTSPIMGAYIVLGLGFGMLAHKYGYGVFVVLCMSIFVFAGSMQYVGIELMYLGVDFLSLFIMSIIIQIRYMFYSISMIDKYKKIKRNKLYTIFSLTDETYSILSLSKEDNENYYFWVSLFNHIYWVIGSLIGFFLGEIISINTKGIEFSMTALFITAFVNAWIENKARAYQFLGFVCAIVSLVFFGKDRFLLASLFFVLIILSFVFVVRKECNG